LDVLLPKIVYTTYDNFDKSNNDINITTMSKDSIEYYFDADMYRFLNDTLDGIAEVNGEPKRIKLATSDIVSISTGGEKRISTTGWIIIAFVGSIGLMILMLSGADEAI
jgi:hypothetical protein